MDAAATTSLLLVTAGALLMPGLARRLSIPVAVAEIGYGAVIGRSGLGLVGGDEHDVLKFVADLGFALFLFVAALEIDVAGILRGGPRSIAMPLGLSAAVVTVALWVAAWMHVPGWLGLAIGVTSVPLVMSVLRELDLLPTPFGRQVILAAGVGELLSIGVLAMFDVTADARQDGLGGLVVGMLRALVPIGATVAAAVMLRSLLWWFPTPFQRFAAAEDPQEFGVRAGFGLMFAGIASAAIGGIEPLLGAFFAGLVVTYVVRSRDVLEKKLAGVAYGFFVPCFFVNVGARLVLDPSIVTANGGVVACVLLGVLLSRLPVFVGYAAAGFEPLSAAAAALLLSAPLTLQIAVADLGVRNGILTPDIEAAVILAAVVGGVVFPALARRLLATERAIDPVAAAEAAPS
jgi:Kef-type K+ transport system membrane component KefB